MLPTLKNLPYRYAERLKACNLILKSHYRRIHGDIIEAFSIAYIRL